MQSNYIQHDQVKISLWLCELCSAVSKLEKNLRKEHFQEAHEKIFEVQIGLMDQLNRK